MTVEQTDILGDEVVELRKACSCLYITVDSSVAADLKAKAEAVIAHTASLQAQLDAWRRGAMLVLDELGVFDIDAAPHIRIRRLRARLTAAYQERDDLKRAIQQSAELVAQAVALLEGRKGNG